MRPDPEMAKSLTGRDRTDYLRACREDRPYIPHTVEEQPTHCPYPCVLCDAEEV